MSKARMAASKLTGGLQCALGGILSVFAYLVYADQSVRATFSITTQEVSLYMFLALVLAVFSFLSGLLLIKEKH